MGLLDKIKSSILGSSKSVQDTFVPHEPRFIKDFSMNNKNLDELQKIYDSISHSSKLETIQRDINFIKKGLYGEKQVAFELKNSFLPLTIFHDLRLEYENYSAQIDFLLLTDRFIGILETKKLSGDIKINSSGEFIRKYKGSSTGMYSPLSQNKRHSNILKYIISKKFASLSLPPIESIVVLANDNTIIDMNDAPESCKEYIIKRDSLADKLSRLYNSHQSCISSDDIDNLSKTLMEIHTPIVFNHIKKYGLDENDFKDSKTYSDISKDENIKCKDSSVGKDASDLFENLRKYRNSAAKEKGYDYKKYHYIFPNSVIDQLIEDMPETLEDLYNIKGLGKVKIESYGLNILSILNTNSCSNSVSESACTQEISLEDALKKYRLDESRRLNIKAYMIFTNKELDLLTTKKPQNIDSLKSINGFSQKKCDNYGQAIINIIRKHS